jgi:DNA-binding response OmpR family regulator
MDQNQAGTVLLVEDDAEFANILKLRIESAGHKVVVSNNGEEALQLTHTRIPDLIILDVFLPDMDGLTVLKRVKAPVDIETGRTSRVKDIPVIVITGKAPTVENITRVEGAADFFVKPVHIDKLIARVGQLLEPAKHG